MVDWDKHKRPHYKKPTWLEWQPKYPMKYLFVLALCLVILPNILGLVLTPLGAILNVFFIDWIFYKKETSMIERE